MEGSSPKYGGWEGFPETAEGCVRADEVSRNRWLFRQGWKARRDCLGHAAEEEREHRAHLPGAGDGKEQGGYVARLAEGHVKNS